ncbi:MAG: SPOR domain-containing protein, partial [Alphaproteobacteria bacterium]
EDENGAAPEQSAQVYGNGPVEQIAVPVAAPIASAPKLPDVHDLGDYAEELDRAAASAARAAPDVDTIAVTENRVDYTEALDLPAVNYEDDAPAHQGMGELETEFAEVFGSIEAETPPSTLAATEESQKADPEQDEYADIFADVFGNEAEQERYSAAAGIAAGGVAAAPVQARTPAAAYRNGPEHDADFGYDPRQDTVDIAAAPHVPAHARARRSALFVPGVAAAVVLVAVAGAVAYKWTGSNGGEPVVIMADKTPIKVKPETTGSTAVPNQDKAVYDKSATSTPTAPEQDKLVTTREDPVDLAAGEEDDTPVADNDDTPAIDKVEERVDPADQDVAANEPAAPGGNNALAPRKVQTMVVKPDGTMVASIGNGSEALSSGPAAAPAERPAAATTTGPSSPVESGNDAIGSLVDAAPADAIPAEAAAPALAPAAPQKSPVAAKPVETRNVTPKTTAAAAPKNVPMVESRPAEQPLDIVDRVPGRNQQAQASAATQQVASVAPAGSYLIQISSQPTVEGAQKSYASLSQRYPSVIGGRGVDIKQAEIAGKGTFYRVRIPAGSKSEAANLCSKYKSAGGSCFVTR